MQYLAVHKVVTYVFRNTKRAKVLYLVVHKVVMYVFRNTKRAKVLYLVEHKVVTYVLINTKRAKVQYLVVHSWHVLDFVVLMLSLHGVDVVVVRLLIVTVFRQQEIEFLVPV